jgi:hypothetical protein
MNIVKLLNKFMSWIKNKIFGLMLATANVEKKTFSQNVASVEPESTQEVGKNQINVINSLMNSEITEEVKDLRWRFYKTVGAQINYDLGKVDLGKIKVDSFDPYPLELLINVKTLSDKVGDEFPTENLSNQEFNKGLNVDSNINITYNSIPKFDLTNFVKKIMVRRIHDKSKLIELHIPKEGRSENRTTNFLMSELKKLTENPRFSNITDVSSIEALLDIRFLEMKIVKFDKIVEFNGNFVIKFIGSISKDESIVEKYKQIELEERYNNKEAR